jgi:hypothetical protein
VWVKSAMTMSIKVWKPFLVITISNHRQVWRGKRWETSVWICVALSKAIVTTISQNVSWTVVHSLLEGHQSNGYLDHQWYDPWHTPNSLRDSNVSPKFKTTEDQGVEAHSMAHNTIEG